MEEDDTLMGLDKRMSRRSVMCQKIISAVFYGTASFMIVVINKTVLTSHQFPSIHFLGIGQMLATIFILLIGKKCRCISFPDANFDVITKVFPLPFLYLGNLVCGLGGTKQLSLPMFTVLRRFSILMTMIAEYYILNIHQSVPVKLTVGAMILGAVIAALNDLAFDATGYTFVLSNDFFTAANGVYMKKKLESKELGKYGLMFYNSVFALIPTFFICWYTGEMSQVFNFSEWTNFMFLIQFFLSCVMGFVLIYSTILCTSHNSALTTTIVGCLKNIFITYIGMFIGGDYIFSAANFLGLSISVIGSLIYSLITFTESEDKSKDKSNLVISHLNNLVPEVETKTKIIV